MLAKTKTSCLSPKDVKELQFEPYVEGHELNIFPQWSGFKIPYFTLEGKVDPSIFRFRFLQTKPSKGLASIAEEPKKPRRYTQPLGTNCGVYLPPIIEGQNWKDISRTIDTPVVITEGELKAACACKLGIPTIGLGGVYNWRSSKDRQELLPILEKFAWKGRTVYIAFDSDSKDNPMVRMAASRLAYTLATRGALVRLVTIPDRIAETQPQEPSQEPQYAKQEPQYAKQKQGLDDFIYALGEKEGYEQFGRLLMESEEIGPGQELHRLNSEVGLVQSTAEVIEVYTGNVYSPGAFSEARYRNRFFSDKTEAGTLVRKPAAKEWLAWEHRTEFTELVYEPACNNMITPEGAYNCWYAQRWPLTPSKKGSLALWERLFNHVFSGLSDGQRQWVRQWLAYPIQFPGTKLHTALLVWGRTTGTGKSRIGESMEHIYGRNYSLITNAHLTDNFTEWAENKQFIVGDEISIGDKRGVANSLKAMITRHQFRLNIKNRKSYMVKDCINYYFSSNHEDALYLENHDRRFFVVHADVDKLEPEFYTAYTRWLEKEGGAERLFHYLLYEVPLEGFNPYGEAPVTTAKLEMMAASRSDVEDWAFSIAADPDKLTGQKSHYDLYTAKELLKLYDPEERGKIKSNGISRALNAAGVYKVASGSNHIVVAQGARDSVYAIRNADRYRRLSPAAISRLYAAEREGVNTGGVGAGQKFAAGRRVQ